ncbi:hypothetical protein GS444_24750 [Rhodococcus hoagii]|nr:hypothetical protein [Prescottella equi]
MVTLEEAKHALETAHRNVLAASLGPIIGIPTLMEYIARRSGPSCGWCPAWTWPPSSAPRTPVVSRGCGSTRTSPALRPGRP